MNVIARSRGKTNEEKDIHWDSLRRGNGQRAHLVIRENEFESCPLITSPQPPPCQFMKCLVVSSWYYLNQPFLIGIISTSCDFRLIKTLLWYATEILKRFSIKKLINFVIFQVGNFPSKIFALIYGGRSSSASVKTEGMITKNELLFEDTVNKYLQRRFTTCKSTIYNL